MEWDSELKEFLLTPQAHSIIDRTKAFHLSLQLPESKTRKK
jgi:hypothetical protein